MKPLQPTITGNAVGGKPAPYVVLRIDEQYVANQTQTAQHTLNAINRSYDQRTVTCQASNPAYSQNSLTHSGSDIFKL